MVNTTLLRPILACTGLGRGMLLTTNMTHCRLFVKFGAISCILVITKFHQAAVRPSTQPQSSTSTALTDSGSIIIIIKFMCQRPIAIIELIQMAQVEGNVPAAEEGEQEFKNKASARKSPRQSVFNFVEICCCCCRLDCCGGFYS